MCQRSAANRRENRSSNRKCGDRGSNLVLPVLTRPYVLEQSFSKPIGSTGYLANTHRHKLHPTTFLQALDTKVNCNQSSNSVHTTQTGRGTARSFYVLRTGHRNDSTKTELFPPRSHRRSRRFGGNKNLLSCQESKHKPSKARPIAH
jgi:hypothetical protein